MKKAIVLFDFTDTTAKALLSAGYDEVWSFDGKHQAGAERVKMHGGEWVKVGMWFFGNRIYQHAEDIACMVGDGVDLVFGYPECTYLTTTGARWFYHPDDRDLPTADRRPHPLYPDRAQKRLEAIDLVKLIPMVAEACECDRWALENPAVSSLNTMWQRPTRTFHPFMFGGYLPDDHQHRTFPDIYPGRDAYHKNTGIWHSESFSYPLPKLVMPVGKEFPGYVKMGGKSARTKEIRSASPEGFITAMAQSNKPR